MLTYSYAPFAVAFVVMLGVGLIELLGVGIEHPGADLDGNGGGSTFLGWLGVGTDIPLLIWLISLLACFTVTGIALQQVATLLMGTPLGWGIASIVALAISLILNSYVSRGLVKILPGFETTVILTDDLLMRRGVVLEGVARHGHPARARVVDRHDQAHYVMVEPHQDGDRIGQGETALLVRRQGTTFFVLPETDPTLRSL